VGNLAKDGSRYSPGVTSPPSRRAFLLAGAGGVALAATGGALVESNLLPGRARLRDGLGLDGPDAPMPSAQTGPMVTGTFRSESRAGLETRWAVSYPPGSPADARLPVLVSLHGKGATHRTFFDLLGLDRFLALVVVNGIPPFAVAAVDGGDRYWHERRAGDDSGAMVMEEFVSFLAGRGLSTDRLGLFGWSMGGYGSLLLAAQAPIGAIGAGAVSSPALWAEAGDAAPGAFDDAEDFAAHDVFADETSWARSRFAWTVGRVIPSTKRHSSSWRGRIRGRRAASNQADTMPATGEGCCPPSWRSSAV